LSPTFKKYVEAMQAITDAKFTKRKDAEDLLAKYEEVTYNSMAELTVGQRSQTIPFNKLTSDITSQFPCST